MMLERPLYLRKYQVVLIFVSLIFFSGIIRTNEIYVQNNKTRNSVIPNIPSASELNINLVCI